MRDRVRETAAALTPRTIALPIYWSLYFCSKVLAKTLAPKAKVWARNSLVLGTVQFSLSDIDISILISDEADAERIRRWSWIFPLVRETNIYRAQNLAQSASHINPIELARDPRLVELLAVLARPATPAHRLVFILRKIESCRRQFTGQLLWQKRKWDSYLSLAGLDGPAYGPEDVYREMDRLGRALGANLDISSVTQQYLNEEKSGRPLHEIATRLDPVALSLFPHRFCFLEPRDPVPLKAVMAAQIEWELWGLECQRVGEFSLEVREHLGRLQRHQDFLNKNDSLANPLTRSSDERLFLNR